MARWLLGIFIFGIVVASVMAGYYGAFSSIKIENEKFPKLLLIYQKHQGNYENIGDVMDKVFYELLKEDLKIYNGFAIYYDNPKVVKEKDLRAIAGSVTTYNENLAKRVEKIESLKVGIIDSSNGVVVNFPLKGVGSILFAVMKVYPKLNEYKKEHNLEDKATMEIYDYKNRLIKFIIFPNIPNKKLLQFLK